MHMILFCLPKAKILSVHKKLFTRIFWIASLEIYFIP